MVRESKIEAYLVKRVKAMGGEVRKVAFIRRRGAPDRIVFFPFSVVIWIELKATGEKAKPHQVREHERMRRMGQRIEVVDSLERVEELLS